MERATIRLEPGEAVAVFGANGAGKSTLLKGLSGLLPLDGGDLRLFGNDIRHLRGTTLARKGLRLLPEGRELFPSLSVQENLRVAAYHHRRQRRRVGNEIDRVLALFPRLQDRFRNLAGTLSGGEQQMLVLARALMFQPRLLLADELSLGLAPSIVAMLYETLGCLRREEGVGLVVVEQNFEVARSLVDRAYVMESGKLKELDLAGSTDDLARSYLGG